MTMFTEEKLISSARTQYRTMFRAMAASGVNWNFHISTVGPVLLQQRAIMDVHFPVLLKNVHAMAEQTMVNQIVFAFRRMSDKNQYGYLQHGKGTAGPFRTERIAVKNEFADRWLAFFEGKWRRVHIQVKRTFIVFQGEKITIQIDGV